MHFRPDQIGDLYFNGVASDVERTLYSGGLQADGSYDLGDKHTIRGGGMLLNETVLPTRPPRCFPWTATAIQRAGRSHHGKRPPDGLFAGVYLQDEWKLFSEIHRQLRRAV